jgi:hypothetical protein
MGALLAGCGGNAQARDVVEDYLTAVSGNAADRGWASLCDDRERMFGDERAYVQLASADAWSQFAWEIGSIERPPDADYLRVDVTVEGPVPGVLVYSPQPPEWIGIARQSGDRQLELRVFGGAFGGCVSADGG